MRIFVFIFLILSSAVHAGRESKGKVKVGGNIVESACTIATEDIWQEVDFGNIIFPDLVSQNYKVEKNFQIRLINCSLERDNGGKWMSASVTFDGQRNESDDTFFSMGGSGNGVGFRIMNSHEEYAHAGKPVSPVMLSNGSTDLNFKIKLIPDNSEMRLGNISSFIRFMVDYQ